MDTKVIISIVVLIAVVVLGAILIAAPGPKNKTPRQFTSENVRVSLPYPDATVLREFIASGEARGTWFFEADFPVEVRDEDGNVVGRGIAHAEDDWMTEEFVQFRAPVTIEGYSGSAELVLIKDNPSGLPEHDDSVSFPIVVQ